MIETFFAAMVSTGISICIKSSRRIRKIARIMKRDVEASNELHTKYPDVIQSEKYD